MTFRIITAAMSVRPPSLRIHEVSFDHTNYKITSLAVFDLIVLTVFGKEQYLRSPSFWSFFHPTVLSSCLSPTRSSATLSTTNLAGNYRGSKHGFCGEKPQPNRPKHEAA